MSDPVPGRSRGRARGRALPTQSQEVSSPLDMDPIRQTLSSISSDEQTGLTGDDNGNGSASVMRGRAGYRGRGPPLQTRPANLVSKMGNVGTAVPLVANYFRLNTPKNIVIFDYHIDFEPQIESSFMRKALLFSQAVREAFKHQFQFDGMSNLKSTILLPSEETEFFATRNNDGKQIRIRVRRVGEIGWGHNEMIRLFNTQMRQYLRFLEWTLIGKHYFNPSATKAITEHRLQLLQGLLTAINTHDGGSTLMVADVVHKVVRTDSVLRCLKDIYSRDQKEFAANARKELTGNVVLTKYNNKTHRIDDIVFDKNPTHKFEKGGITMSLIEYYQQQYKTRIQDESQPLLLAMPSTRQIRSGQTNQILLVPELCYMTGISDSMANDFRVRQSLTREQQQNPNQRVEQLNQFMDSLNKNQKVREDMCKWGLDFDHQLVRLDGRVLPSEPILVCQQTGADKVLHKQSWNQESGDFSKDIRTHVMYSPVSISKWLIITTPREQNLTQEFADTLHQVFRPMGVHLGKPEIRVVENDRTSTYVEASKAIPPGYQIIVVILPNNNKDRYDAIKKIFCCEHPVASQLVVSKTLAKRVMMRSVCTKIGVQMACKVGAQPWALDIPPKNLMVVGFDVNRDSDLRQRAIGAFVCSTNQTLTKWYSCVSPHQNREELSNKFKAHFQSGLKCYYKTNNSPPQTIVIYRDGVGEGDIEHVFNYELVQIEDAIKEIFSNITIKLCFVIVTKRINSRFFRPIRSGSQTNYSNPIPGTVVDSVVTRNERYDYYLISQSVRQGTVTPTMYNIIKDETNWAPHHHQQLAFKLTHLYYNWIGTIRVPAPCQYAHKLAYLTGTSLHRPFHSQLAETLFYL